MKLATRIAIAAVVLSASGLILMKSSAAPNGVTMITQHDPPPSGQRPKVDIVFVLDTTGSMGGLIEGAKQKIWDIARKAQQGQPAPEVRVGLVAYRDKGDEYVTKVFDLGSDMDAVYSKLTDLRAVGGGDGPEHVLRGLHDAVDNVRWSTDPNAIKLVYLVGDAPPHFDYDDGITQSRVLAGARDKGIYISAIRCGSDTNTLSAWTDIAQKSGGEVATIEQNGGVVAVATPYDSELARLNADLAKTEVRWGSARERKEAADAVSRSLAAPAAVQADRAAFWAANAAAKTGPAKRDLVAGGDLGTIEIPALPEEMQRMSEDERARYVAQKRKDREQILARIRETQSKRDGYTKTAAPEPAPTAFDSKVYDSLRKAGAEKGVGF